MIGFLTLTVFPIFIGLFNLLFIRSKKICNYIYLILSIICFLFSFYFFRRDFYLVVPFVSDFDLYFKSNYLASFIMIFVNFFVFLISIYSLSSDLDRKFFVYLPILLGFSNMVLFSYDFLSLIFSWGTLLVVLYFSLSICDYKIANKSFVILGFADFLLILGIFFYYALTGSFLMNSKVALNNLLAYISFVFMAIGALAKAGSMPFHTWIPKASNLVYQETIAIFVGSLDKLLGIYLLARICSDFFVLNNFAFVFLLIIGSFTIIFAVLLALIQHDIRSLLSFHAISQVGYMVLGFGSGNILGLVGGIFHMINHSIYKSGLFLAGGYIGRKNKSFLLEDLGNLTGLFPITFLCSLIFSFSISGIPPFNGFSSKWFLYQGIIFGIYLNSNFLVKFIYIFSLISAMFGSALTLASFLKFISGVFLGNLSSNSKDREDSFFVRISLLILAFLCLLLGVFPFRFLGLLFPYFNKELVEFGFWQSSLAFIFLLVGLIFGFLFYLLTKFKFKRKDKIFFGSETTLEDINFSSLDYYKSLEENKFLDKIYFLLKKECFDIYNIILKVFNFLSFILFKFVERFIYIITNFFGFLVMGLSFILRKIHNGILDNYLVWIFLGLIFLFFIVKI